MRSFDEKRAEKYIKKHNKYKKWLMAVGALALVTGIITMYLLHEPASAVSEDGAEEIGMVLNSELEVSGEDVVEETLADDAEEVTDEAEEEVEDTVDDAEATSDETASEEETSDTTEETDTNTETEETTDENSEEDSSEETTDESSEATSDASTEASSEETDSSNEADSSDYVLPIITATFVDKDGNSISDVSDIELTVEDVLDLTTFATELEGYEYVKASVDGVVISAISKVTDSEDNTVLSYIAEDGTTSNIESDITVNLIYKKAEEIVISSVKATIVDEFGEEIDSDNYTEIDLPEFSDDEILTLDDTENPPYEDIKIKTGILKTVKYEYVKTTIGNSILKGLKKAVVEGTGDYIYSYTTDGTNWTEITEDTVINFVYSAGTQTEYTYEDDNIKVTAKLQQADAIPDDAELVVTQVTADSSAYNYDAYMDALNDNSEVIAEANGIEETVEYTEENTLLYDIAFMLDGVEVEPAEGSVSIKAELKNKQVQETIGVVESDELSVIHLPLSDEALENVSSTAEATDITAADVSVEVLTDATVELGESDSDVVDYTLSSLSLVAFTNSYEKIDYTRDFIKFTDGTYYYFDNTFTVNDSDWPSGKTLSDISLEYHVIDSADEQYSSSFAPCKNPTGTYVNDANTLGVAGNFHIVAFETATTGSHVNGNILANKILAYNNFGTNGSIDEITYVSGYYSKVNSNTENDSNDVLVLGSQNTVTLTDNGNAFSVNGTKMDHIKVIYVESDGYVFYDESQLQTDVQTISDSLAAKSSTVGSTITQNGSSYTLSSDSDFGVINLTASELTSAISFYFNGSSSDTIIVNVDCEGRSSYSLPGYNPIYINGIEQSTSETTTFTEGKVLWNFYNCSGTQLTISKGVGAVIAVGADITANSNWNGTIIADNVYCSGETHRSDFVGKTSGDSSGYSVSKSFADDATWPSGSTYDFVIEGISDNDSSYSDTVTLSESVTSDSFDAITYTYDASYVGTTVDYYYKIYEVVPSSPVENVSYDPTVYYVRESVKYAYTNGNKTATITDREYYVDSTGSITDYTTITGWTALSDSSFAFENSIATGTSITIGVTKEFADDNWPDDTEFDFQLTYTGMTNAVSGAVDAPTIAETDGIITLTKSSSTGYYTEITFPYVPASLRTDDKTNIKYYFELSEVEGDYTSITYDDTVYYIYVQVDYDDVNKTTTAKVKSCTDNSSSSNYANASATNDAYMFTFTNTYVEGELNFGATKYVDGSTDITSSYYDGMFLFELTHYDTKQQKWVHISYANNEGSDVTFPAITSSNEYSSYFYPGSTHWYRIQEQCKPDFTGTQSGYENIVSSYYNTADIWYGDMWVWFVKVVTADDGTVKSVTYYRYHNRSIDDVKVADVFSGQSNPDESFFDASKADEYFEKIETSSLADCHSICKLYNSSYTTYTVTKNWQDNDDQYGLRWDSVYVQLYKTVNGETSEVGTMVELNDANNWTYTFGTPVYSGEDASVLSSNRTWDSNYAYVFYYTNSSGGTTAYAMVTSDPNGNAITYSSKEFYLDSDGNYVEITDSDTAVANYVPTLDSDGNIYTDTTEAIANAQGEPITNYYREFTNKLVTSLTVNKQWLDSTGAPISVTAPLIVYLCQKVNNEWTILNDTISLSSENDWTYTVENLNVFDEDGNEITYMLKEDVNVAKQYSVSYEYGGTTYLEDDVITLPDGSTGPSYEMPFNNSTGNNGTVVITNKRIIDNVLPSTGGIGTTIFYMAGVLLIVIAMAGFMTTRVLRRRR